MSIKWIRGPYNAHYGMQREVGLYGSIRVSIAHGKTELFSYDHDRSIILTDWYHNTTYEQALGLSSNPFDWVGEPQSLLIQGKGRYNCSLVSSPYVCNAASPQCSPYVFTVVPGKTYRLRVSSLTSLSALNFQIEVGIIKNFTVVSYSLLLLGQVIFHTKKWSVNNVSFNLPHTPYLIALKENITGAFDPTPPPNGYDFVNYDIYNVANNTNATSSNSIYRLQFNTTVDIILQNANTMNKNNSETHPWHLHGHNFWVLGYGEGKFDNFINDFGNYYVISF
uniref:L-ascorbate oxidase-like n=1 Tax=Vitis vinifera TaxID=29760 RepID=F6H4N0_VITVI